MLHWERTQNAFKFVQTKIYCSTRRPPQFHIFHFHCICALCIYLELGVESKKWISPHSIVSSIYLDLFTLASERPISLQSRFVSDRFNILTSHSKSHWIFAAITLYDIRESYVDVPHEYLTTTNSDRYNLARGSSQRKKNCNSFSVATGKCAKHGGYMNLRYMMNVNML